MPIRHNAVNLIISTKDYACRCVCEMVYHVRLSMHLYRLVGCCVEVV